MYSFSHCSLPYFSFFFFNDTATTEIYTLSLHDALPISKIHSCNVLQVRAEARHLWQFEADRKSTRLNSSHGYISYAVFCLKKKKKWKSATSLPKNNKRQYCGPPDEHHL